MIQLQGITSCDNRRLLLSSSTWKSADKTKPNHRVVLEAFLPAEWTIGTSSSTPLSLPSQIMRLLVSGIVRGDCMSDSCLLSGFIIDKITIILHISGGEASWLLHHFISNVPRQTVFGQGENYMHKTTRPASLVDETWKASPPAHLQHDGLGLLRASRRPCLTRVGKDRSSGLLHISSSFRHL